MVVNILPDTEAIAITYLLGITAVTDLFGQRIGTLLDITGPAGLPALRLTRIAAPSELNHLRAGQVQYEAFADTELEAQDGAELVRAHLFNEDPTTGIVGTHAGLGVVTGVTNALGPRPQPDPTGIPRWLGSVNIFAHPLRA